LDKSEIVLKVIGGNNMKNLTIYPASSVQGKIEVPGDKSISHRSIMMGSLAYGTTEVSNFLSSADCLSTLEIFKAMGVRIRRRENFVSITGRGLNGLKAPKHVLNAGNSGTTSRILLGLLAAQPFSCRLTGDQYLQKRPMKRVTEPLSLMGAHFEGPGNGSYLPLTVHGSPLKGIDYAPPVASAQVKSSLLMAGLYAEGRTTVREPLATRDHTERMFAAFGIPFTHKGNTVVLQGPVEPFKARRIRVPGDISSAAFFIVAALIVPNSRLVIHNVGINPTRTGILDVLKRMGARIQIKPLKVGKGEEPVADLTVESSDLHGVEVGGDVVPRMIDEFPVLAVAAIFAKGRTVVRDAEDLKVKESDRIHTTATGLSRMGANIQARKDGWLIHGGVPLRGASVSSFGDHRIAMSLAVAALRAEGKTVIGDTENIGTSFPTFEKLLRKVAKKI
jgi:3-phosphoshikimate 1-carboxyvinyltransferase